ncbi:CU044_5270 family protein [Dactylosporangium sp. CA-139066]|uniref:CU044_5270 family protein n=1 Tax=Dactylosporangium sp. CA-139066 TaxID=3239930 RepID=UPI003D92E096
MSTHRDTMRALAQARPNRLTPDSPLPDPSTLMTYTPQRLPQATAPRGRAPRRLVLAGAGLAVAAAAAAAVALPADRTNPAGKGTRPADTTAAQGPVTAIDLLLVAAQRYDATLNGGGRYWVQRATHGDGTRQVTDEQWLATRDGDPSVGFFRDPSGAWSARPLQGHTAANNFLLAGQPRSAADLSALPSQPDQLKAKLLQWYTGEGEMSGTELFLFYCGTAIVLDLPVAAPVRAAAYRMLAGLPGVTSLGRVTDALGRDGMAVGFTRRGDSGTDSQLRLIVAAGTGQALAEESWNGGRRLSYTAVLKAEWSDTALPNAADIR